MQSLFMNFSYLFGFLCETKNLAEDLLLGKGDLPLERLLLMNSKE